MRISIIIIVHRITVVIISIAIFDIVLITGITRAARYNTWLLIKSTPKCVVFSFLFIGITFTSVGAGEDTDVQLWRPGRTSFLFRQVFLPSPKGAESLSAINSWLACSLEIN